MPINLLYAIFIKLLFKCLLNKLNNYDTFIQAPSVCECHVNPWCKFRQDTLCFRLHV